MCVCVPQTAAAVNVVVLTTCVVGKVSLSQHLGTGKNNQEPSSCAASEVKHMLHQPSPCLVCTTSIAYRCYQPRESGIAISVAEGCIDSIARSHTERHLRLWTGWPALTTPVK